MTEKTNSGFLRPASSLCHHTAVPYLFVHLVQIIKLLIQNHTDASIIINEFEKIRTGKLLMSETFSLAHVIPVNTGINSNTTPLLK